MYDHETELYYLQSRYYDSQIGRFLNADIVFDYDAGLQGFNLYIYCGNNPINRIDISGADSEEFDGDPNLKDEEETMTLGPGGDGKSSGGNGDTVIYRYGYTSSAKLVPTQADVNSDTGLSFSTSYKSGSAMTTTEAINSSKFLYAVKDGKTHVSIYPVGATILEWHNAGIDSIWTQELVRLVTLS